MSSKGGIDFDQFERAIDEFFNELLIDRWHCGSAEAFERAEVVDLPDRYEVRVAAHAVDPRKIDVEVRGQRLTMRAPAAEGRGIESSFAFPDAIDADVATARLSKGTLTVVLPKHKPKRIALKDS
jgi:HSP20 family molecular chaperone IbpA